ncbi:MAG: hypothetical protein CTY34_02630 [Methylobacter sp.]|nr:MAG: hypothetical protein CTY34_02630 [Methylobacter sp.]PPD04057.1 MAG: hypothetical protein CTY29_07205 [Methylobacter sp.]PPD23336.1 MAG: hypothetical protein CTY24_04625 [Methylobacter sp.]PPD34897.1 MAG: hypothetical protein CTY18_07440 [Methylomonas sp.]
MKEPNDPALTADQVEAYLHRHPEFFNEHLHLLEKMQIPHPCGDAVSLISKQLEIFRAKHQEQENQLTALIDIARENDTSINRMHKLTLALLEAATLEELVANLDLVLSEHFLTDFTALRIIRPHVPHSAIANLCLEPTKDNLEPFSKELSSNQPKCGRPTLAQAKILFGDAAAEAKSCAIIPLIFGHLEGLLAIGSRQEGRFHYSMGHVFLMQMAEITGTRLLSLLPAES